MRTPTKKRVARRLKIIEGQVRGLGKMVAKDAYCIDIITQTAAARQALSSVEDALLENHLATCAASQMKGGAQRKAAREILSVYKLSKQRT